MPCRPRRMQLPPASYERRVRDTALTGTRACVSAAWEPAHYSMRWAWAAQAGPNLGVAPLVRVGP
jgi:hypothetical protein